MFGFGKANDDCLCMCELTGLDGTLMTLHVEVNSLMEIDDLKLGLFGKDVFYFILLIYCVHSYRNHIVEWVWPKPSLAG